MVIMHSFLKIFLRNDEKSNLGWMYKQEKPELEEYLLGRKIDKHVDEDANQETKSGKCKNQGVYI